MQNSAKIAASAVRYLEIDAGHAGQRLDNFLITTLKGVPKSHIYRLLRKGEVRVNKGRRQPDYRLQAGDVVRVPPVRRAAETKIIAKIEDFQWLEDIVLYEDEYLLAVNKPSGLAVHGGSGVTLGLIEALRRLRPQARFLELAHRLDRETSGCLLLAKRRPALLALHAQLRDSSMDKRYLALVRGVWQGKSRRVETALQRDQLRGGEREVRVAAEGKAAASRFIPRQLFGDASLMEIKLITGRTHQARVHAAHLGHPIAGDEKYGDPVFNRRMRERGLKRLFLHAASMTLRHPERACKMRIEAPLPAELSRIIEYLQHEKL